LLRILRLRISLRVTLRGGGLLIILIRRHYEVKLVVLRETDYRTPVEDGDEGTLGRKRRSDNAARPQGQRIKGLNQEYEKDKAGL